MSALLSPAEAARRMGVSASTVREWIFRADNPLPSVVLGDPAPGRREHRRVVASCIEQWLAEEASRTASAIRGSR